MLGADDGFGLPAGWFLENLWLAALIPGIAFALILLVGKRMPMKGSGLGIASMAASLVIASGAAYQWVQRVDAADGHTEEGAFGLIRGFARSLAPQAAEGGHLEPFVEPVTTTWVWWSSGGLEFTIGSNADGLSVLILWLVAFISLLVQIFSLDYVRGDRRYTHFFASITLFSAGMLVMVMAPNMVQLILGWEIMGLCSFLLIGHWWEEDANSVAALKAFWTVRVGDVGLLVGTAIVFFGANAWAQDNLGMTGFDIEAIQGWALSGEGSNQVILWAAIALFIACIGKSGQFPLHTWLPDAMAGPTPVSSLLHSSTMVVAGVFLVARLYPVFWTGFNIGTGGLSFVAIIGGITIIIAALLAFVQDDIKKVLAYSTVSQLGYMMLGLGTGAWLPAVFHIFTHAFFKCCLFLCAGSVSHSGSHHSFDMKKDMGGLRKKMPVTFASWIVSTLALTGVFPFAGFWSKDEILADAWADSPWVFVVGMAGVYLTALYVGRMMIMTFAGEYRGGMQAEDEDHAGDAHAGGHHAPPHESPSLMTLPLLVLAVLAFAAGFLNVPGFHWLGDILEGWLPHKTEELLTHTDFKLWIAVTSVAIGLAGLGTAWAIYEAKMLDAARIRSFLQPLPQLLDHRYYLDYLYETVFVKELVLGSSRWGLALWDEYVIDGAVNGLATATGWSAKQLKLAQTGQVQLYGGVMFLGTIAAVVGILVVNP